MKHGFVKVAAITSDIKVADVRYNCEEICKRIQEAEEKGAKILVFPELCLTGCTCGDLFAQEILLRETKKAVQVIAGKTKDKGILVFVGMPVSIEGQLFDVAAAINDGRIIGFTTRFQRPAFENEYIMREFKEGPSKVEMIEYDGEMIPFGSNILYQADEMPELIVSAKIGDDLTSLLGQTAEEAREGAVFFAHCGATPELVGKRAAREEIVKVMSSSLKAGLICADAGEGESTTDVVYAGHNLIAENGKILEKTKKFSNGMILSEIDVFRLLSERRKSADFNFGEGRTLTRVKFKIKKEDTMLTRKIPSSPFIPDDEDERKRRCEDILTIQSLGLKKRLEHTHAKTAVIGISGGLDSTLAILVTARAFDLAGKDRKDIIAVTMPCFGTTDRTYQNACRMTEKLGARLIEVPIAESVSLHFKDIHHDKDVHDVTYENSQARERTQVLMDIANQEGGMVIGTGDLSELALGWATYNGDHMSMYGVNADIPKTLVRHLVRYYAMTCKDKEMEEVLMDVLDTPVSPELLPPSDGKIAQKTEDLVGPYELHDFYLYYLLRFGFEPSKIFRLAKEAFKGDYEEEIMLKWLKIFCRRFFNQQFKRSCLPDGPKIGSVGISPRGGLHMPSDACAALWLNDLEEL